MYPSFFLFQGTEINFRPLFLYEIQQKSCHRVIRVYDLLHTLKNEYTENN